MSYKWPDGDNCQHQKQTVVAAPLAEGNHRNRQDHYCNRGDSLAGCRIERLPIVDLGPGHRCRLQEEKRQPPTGVIRS